MSPSVADAAMGRIAQGTSILAEGGYEKILCQTFETVPEGQVQNPSACYLSTSAGPVMGILYVSLAKLAFCSDSPLSYTSGGKTEWSYYKVCRHLFVLPIMINLLNQRFSYIKLDRGGDQVLVAPKSN